MLATRPNAKHSTQKQARFGHAVVIGGGIAGLAAARVLHEYATRVTVIDRDTLPVTPEFRRGVPQARHAHTLMRQAVRILEARFPGIVAELEAHGATVVRSDGDIAFFSDGEWRSPRQRGGNGSLFASRPLLETVLRQRVSQLPGVSFRQGYRVLGLVTDAAQQQVSGVKVSDSRHQVHELQADIVLDASGRASRAPEWLESLGLLPPEEWRIDAHVGYTTRTYRRPADWSARWKTLYVQPAAPNGTRGGIVLPLEGDRWQVTLIGVGGDYPPTDAEEFLAFAHSLPTQVLYEAIQDAEPLDEPAGYRRTWNQVRTYDRLPRYLEGFLVAGDAVYALNPMYAQGMTAAVLGAEALEQALQTQAPEPDLWGMAQTFQAKLSRLVAHLWRLSTSSDWQWTETDIFDDEQVGKRHLAAQT